MEKAKRNSLGIPYKAGTSEYQREWRKLNPERVHASYKKGHAQKRIYSRHYRYGITEEQFQQKLEEQKNVCAICGTDTPGRNHENFHVDHCHTTGKIRGLLCDKCNRGLGYFNDNPDALRKAAHYLEANGTTTIQD